MESLAGITAFVHAAQLKSFAAAGRQLGVSASAIGKSIKRLEDHLGVRVLHRSTRSVSLTAEGSVFFEHCRRILQELAEAENVIARGRARPPAPGFTCHMGAALHRAKAERFFVALSGTRTRHQF